ncbi:hypothetical protein [Heyndrickxia vini]|uniref:Uncharacterized protein n=1 Tax=Heyndrickxia vini TaxID=1476025 RepID=A0ABX7DY52_9BACI|nr:hypothetical protein [Heyndrickxia vini]QQZ08409.1 hypothetical protein I5776_15230 [Heyndrickxia vini]
MDAGIQVLTRLYMYVHPLVDFAVTSWVGDCPANSFYLQVDILLDVLVKAV